MHCLGQQVTLSLGTSFSSVAALGVVAVFLVCVCLGAGDGAIVGFLFLPKPRFDDVNNSHAKVSLITDK
jgi:hypothetical protein